jgi:hypothetical protein
VAWRGVGLRARDGKWYWFLIGHDAVFTNRDASHGSAVYAALLLRFSLYFFIFRSKLSRMPLINCKGKFIVKV